MVWSSDAVFRCRLDPPRLLARSAMPAARGPGGWCWIGGGAKPAVPEPAPFQTHAASPRGRWLATASSGGLLVWDAGAVRSEAELAGWLETEDARRACLRGDLEPLRRRLLGLAAGHLQAGPLLPRLDAEEFAERERAARDLESLGESAAFALGAALEGKPSLEVALRVRRVLGTVAPEVRRLWGDPVKTRGLLATLGRLGTHEARSLLRAVAAQGGPLGDAARAALREGR
ncbi:MAG: hypothetical protein ACRC33_10395 [Gemmataceae bacterium]